MKNNSQKNWAKFSCAYFCWVLNSSYESPNVSWVLSVLVSESLFHVKWYPQVWGSTGLFPCVRGSNHWLPICSRSWSPKPACPLGVPSPHLCLYWGAGLVSEIFALWDCISPKDAHSLSTGRSFRVLSLSKLELPLPTPAGARCPFNLHQSKPLAWHSSAGTVCFNSV